MKQQVGLRGIRGGIQGVRDQGAILQRGLLQIFPVKIVFHVAADVEVHVAVAVVVAPRCSSPEAAILAEAGAGSRLGKRAAAIVAIENDAVVAGHDQVETAVVVIVGPSRCHPDALEGDSGLLGDVCKRPITIVVVEAIAAG